MSYFILTSEQLPLNKSGPGTGGGGRVSWTLFFGLISPLLGPVWKGSQGWLMVRMGCFSYHQSSEHRTFWCFSVVTPLRQCKRADGFSELAISALTARASQSAPDTSSEGELSSPLPQDHWQLGRPRAISVPCSLSDLFPHPKLALQGENEVSSDGFTLNQNTRFSALGIR